MCARVIALVKRHSLMVQSQSSAYSALKFKLIEPEAEQMVIKRLLIHSSLKLNSLFLITSLQNLSNKLIEETLLIDIHNKRLGIIDTRPAVTCQ